MIVWLFCGCRSGGHRPKYQVLRLKKPGVLGHSLLKAEQSGIPERLPPCAISAPAFLCIIDEASWTSTRPAHTKGRIQFDTKSLKG
jgi:hypothetical protein